MEATFVVLLAAYLVAEFVLRPAGGRMALALHLVIVAVLTTALLGTLQPLILIVVLIAHIATELLRPFRWDVLVRFMIEQAIHLGALVLAAALSPQALAGGWDIALGPDFGLYLATLTVVAGAIVNLKVGGVIIGQVTQQFRRQVPDNLIAGLERGSLYIGWLERALVMLLVLIDQAAGVGFLITAKSILRFSDAKDADHRKASEYIIIGTFMSFGWGLAVSFATIWTMRHWVG